MMNRKIAFAFIGMILLSFLSMQNGAEAKSCGKEYLSIEDSYIQADIVFKGTIISKDSQQYMVKVDESYKISDSKRAQLEFYSYAANFKPGAQYIFYADYDYSSEEPRIVVDGCSRTRPTATQLISDLKQQINAPDENMRAQPSIFIGRVVAVDHALREKSTKLKKEMMAESVVDFEIQDILRNVGELNLKRDGGHVSVFSSSCGIQYELGREYLVYLGEQKVPVDSNGVHREYQRRYFLLCGANFVFDMNEQNRLRQLMKL